jgi:hypothetical protein
LAGPRRRLVADVLMHDGDGTSSLPWVATGCMTYRAEIKKAGQCQNK